MNDWPAQLSALIEQTVALVRDRTVLPAENLTRAIVWGVLGTCVALPALFLLLFMVFRGLVVIYQGEVWLAWLTLGGMFLIGGGFCWSKRTA